MYDPNDQPGDPQSNQGAPADAAAAAATNPDPANDAGKGEGKGGEGDGTAKADAAKDGAKDGQQEPEKPAADATDAGPPEAYADFALPDGFELSGERRTQAEGLFRDLGLSQDRAQKAIDWFVGQESARGQSTQDAVQSAIATQREEWGRETATLFGANQEREMGYARTAVQAVESPELIALWDELGWGNNPHLVKAFATFGKMMRDSPMDTTRQGGAPQTKSLADRMYPD